MRELIDAGHLYIARRRCSSSKGKSALLRTSARSTPSDRQRPETPPSGLGRRLAKREDLRTTVDIAHSAPIW